MGKNPDWGEWWKPKSEKKDSAFKELIRSYGTFVIMILTVGGWYANAVFSLRNQQKMFKVQMMEKYRSFVDEKFYELDKIEEKKRSVYLYIYEQLINALKTGKKEFDADTIFTMEDQERYRNFFSIWNSGPNLYPDLQHAFNQISEQYALIEYDSRLIKIYAKQGRVFETNYNTKLFEKYVDSLSLQWEKLIELRSTFLVALDYELFNSIDIKKKGPPDLGWLSPHLIYDGYNWEFKEKSGHWRSVFMPDTNLLDKSKPEQFIQPTFLLD